MTPHPSSSIHKFRLYSHDTENVFLKPCERLLRANDNRNELHVGDNSEANTHCTHCNPLIRSSAPLDPNHKQYEATPERHASNCEGLRDLENQIFITWPIEGKDDGSLKISPKQRQTYFVIFDKRKRCTVDSKSGDLQQRHMETIGIPLAMMQLSTGNACRISFQRKVKIFGLRKLCQTILDHDLLCPGVRINSIYALELNLPSSVRVNLSWSWSSGQIGMLRILPNNLSGNNCWNSSILSIASLTLRLESQGRGPTSADPNQLSDRNLMSHLPTTHWLLARKQSSWRTIESQIGELLLFLTN